MNALNVKKGLLRLWAVAALVWAAVVGGMYFNRAWEQYQDCVKRVEVNTLTRELDKIMGGDGACSLSQALTHGDYVPYGLALIGVPLAGLIGLYAFGWVARGFKEAKQ